MNGSNWNRNSMVAQKAKEQLAARKPFVVGPGFRNLGNTCYLNSILQVMMFPD